MSHPAVVAAPLSLEARPGERFPVSADTFATGDPDASLTALVRARIGVARRRPLWTSLGIAYDRSAAIDCEGTE